MSEAGFELHPRLAADTAVVCDLPLSRVLLMDDAAWPWLILVPRRAGMREWLDLARPEQHHLLDEIDHAGRVLQARFKPDKLNIAALGNMVEQLHVHLIARHREDPAWPHPVWGRQPRTPYSQARREALVETLRGSLAGFES